MVDSSPDSLLLIHSGLETIVLLNNLHSFPRGAGAPIPVALFVCMFIYVHHVVDKN